LLDAEYRKLKEAEAGTHVSVRKLIKTMRDAHRLDIGMGVIKTWVNATAINIEIEKDSASNEHVLIERDIQSNRIAIDATSNPR